MAEDILGSDAGNLVESVGINLELTESANFADELLSSAGALSVFSEKVGAFAVNVGQMNRELTATIGTLHILNKSMGPTHKLAGALSKIADASVRIESLDTYTRSAVASVNELASAFNNLSKAAASVPSVDSVFGKSISSSKKSAAEGSKTAAALSRMTANARAVFSEALSAAFQDVEISKTAEDVLAERFQQAIKKAIREAQVKKGSSLVANNLLVSQNDISPLEELEKSFLKEKDKVFDNIADGLRKGAKNLPSTTKEIGQDIGESLLKGVTESLGIRSPSKVMEEIVSEFIPAGAHAGLPQAMSKMSAIGSSIGKALSESIAKEIKSVAVRALELLAEERGSIKVGAAIGADIVKRPRKLSSVRIKKTDVDPLQSAGLLPGPGPSLTPQERELLERSGKQKIVYVDLETTGLSPDSDEIVQLSAIKVDKSGARSLTAYPETQRTVADIEQKAASIRSDIDRLTKAGASRAVIDPLKKQLDFLENHTIPTMREAAQQTRHSLEEIIKAFGEFTEDALIIGHNAAMKSGSLERGFDRTFLEKAGYKQEKSIWGDTLAAAKNLNIRSYLGDRKLSSLYATFTEQDIAKVESASHKADFDVWASRVLLNKMMEEEPDIDLLSKYKALVSNIGQSGPFAKLDANKAKEFYNAIVEYYTSLDEGIEEVSRRLEERFRDDENLTSAFKELAKRGNDVRESAVVAIAADDKEAIRQIVGFIMSITNAVGDMQEIEAALVSAGEKLKKLPIDNTLKEKIQNRRAQIVGKSRPSQAADESSALQTVKGQIASQINTAIGNLDEDVIFEIDEVLDDLEQATVGEIAQKSIKMGKKLISVVDSDWDTALKDASKKIKKGRSSVDNEVQQLLTKFDRNLSSLIPIEGGDSQERKEKVARAAIAVQRVEEIVAELLKDPSKLAESILELSNKFNLTVDASISLLQDRARFLQAQSTRGVRSNVNYKLGKLLSDLANEATRRDWTVDIEPSIEGQLGAHPVRNRLYPYTEWIPAQLTFESILQAMGVYGYLPKRDSSSFGGGAQSKTKRYLDPTAGIRNVGATRMRAGGAGAVAPWEYFNRSFRSAKYQEVMSERLKEAAFSPLTNEDVARIVAMSQNEEAIKFFSAIQGATPFKPAVPEPPRRYRTPESSGFFLNWAEQLEKYILPKIIDVSASLEEQATNIREKKEEIFREILSYLPDDEELRQKPFFTGTRESLAGSLIGYVRKKKSLQSEYEQRVQEGNEPYVYTQSSEYLSRFQEILRAGTTLSQKLNDLKDLDNDLKRYYNEKVRQYEEIAKQLSDVNASPEAIAEAKTMRDFYEKLANREDEGSSRQIIAATQAIQKINEKYDRMLKAYSDALDRGEGAGAETFISEEIAKIETAYARRIENIERAIKSVESQEESPQVARLKKIVEDARQQFPEDEYQSAWNQYKQLSESLNSLREAAKKQEDIFGADLNLIDQISQEIDSISEQIKFANATLEMTDEQLKEIGATRQNKEYIQSLEKRRNVLLTKRANLPKKSKVQRDEDRQLIQDIINATEELENQRAIMSPLSEARNRLSQAELELQIATEEAQQSREIALSDLRYRKSKLESEKAAQIASIRAASADFPAEIEKRRQKEIAAQQEKITAATAAAISDPNIRFAASEIRRMQKQSPQYEDLLAVDAAVKEYFGYGKDKLPEVRDATLGSIIGRPRGSIPNSVLQEEQAKQMAEQLIGGPNQQLKRALEFISNEGRAKSALMQYYRAGERTRSTEIKYLQSLVAPIGSTQTHRQRQIYDAFNFAQELLGQISLAESQIASLEKTLETFKGAGNTEQAAQIEAQIKALKENITKFNNVLWEPGGPIAQLRVFINIANDYVKAQISEISSGSTRYVSSQEMMEMTKQVPARPEGISLSPAKFARKKREELESQVPRGIEGELREQRAALIDAVRRGVKEEEKLAFEIVKLYSSGQANDEEFQQKSEALIDQYQKIVRKNQINRKRISDLRIQSTRSQATNADYGGVWSGDISDQIPEEPTWAVGGAPSLPRRGPAFSYGRLVGINADPKSVQWIDAIYENIRQISKIFDSAPVPPQIKEEEIEQYEQTKEQAANLFDTIIKRYMEALSEAAYAAIKDPSNVSEFESRITKAQAQFSRDIQENKSLLVVGDVFGQVVEGLGKEQLLQANQIVQSTLEQVKKTGSASVAGRLYERPMGPGLLSVIQKKKELDDKSFLYAVRRAISLKETPLRSGSVETAVFKPIEDISKANDEILKALVASYEVLVDVVKNNVRKASRSGSFDVIKFIKRFEPQDIAGLYEELNMKESDLALDYNRVFERVFERVAQRLPRKKGEEVATNVNVAFDYIQKALDNIVLEYIDTHTEDVIAFLHTQGDNIDATIFDQLRELSPDDLASNLIVGYTEIYKSIKEHFLREVGGSLDDEVDKNLISRVFQDVKSTHGEDDEVARILLKELQDEDRYQRDAFARFITSIFDARKADQSLVTSIASEFAIGQDIGKFIETLFDEGSREFAPGVMTGAMRRYDSLISEYFKQLSELDGELVGKYATTIGELQIRFASLKDQAKELRSIEDVEKYAASIGEFLTNVQNLVVRISSEVGGLIEAQRKTEEAAAQAAKATEQAKQKTASVPTVSTSKTKVAPSVDVVPPTAPINQSVQTIAQSAAAQAGNVVVASATQTAQAAIQSATNVVAKATAVASQQAIQQSAEASSQVASAASQAANIVAQTARAVSGLANDIANAASTVQPEPQQQPQQAPPSSVISQQMIAQGAIVPVTLVGGPSDPGVAAILSAIVSAKDEVLNAIVSQATQLLNAFGALAGKIITSKVSGSAPKQTTQEAQTTKKPSASSSRTSASPKSLASSGSAQSAAGKDIETLRSSLLLSFSSAMERRVFSERKKILSILPAETNKDRIAQFNAEIDDILNRYLQSLSDALSKSSSRTEALDQAHLVKNQMLRAVDQLVTPIRRLEIDQKAQNISSSLQSLLREAVARVDKIADKAEIDINSTSVHISQKIKARKKISNAYTEFTSSIYEIIEDVNTNLEQKKKQIDVALTGIDTRFAKIVNSIQPRGGKLTGGSERVYTTAKLRREKTLSYLGDALEPLGENAEALRLELQKVVDKAWKTFDEGAKRLSRADITGVARESAIRELSLDLNRALSEVKKRVKDELDRQALEIRQREQALRAEAKQNEEALKAEERQRKAEARQNAERLRAEANQRKIEADRKRAQRDLALRFKSIANEVNTGRAKITLKAENIIEFVGWEKYQRNYAKRIEKLIKKTNKEINARLPKLKVAAAQGDRESFKATEREIKFFLRSVTDELDQTQRVVDERARKIAKSFANIQKYREWEADPEKYFEERRMALLKYDDGFAGRRARRKLLEEEAIARARAFTAIAKARTSVLAKILAAPFVLIFNIIKGIIKLIAFIVRMILKVAKTIISVLVPAFGMVFKIVGLIGKLLSGIIGLVSGLLGKIMGLVGKVAGAVTSLLPKFGEREESSSRPIGKRRKSNVIQTEEFLSRPTRKRKKPKAIQTIEDEIDSQIFESSIDSFSVDASGIGKKHADEYVDGFNKEVKQKKGIVQAIKDEFSSVPYGIGAGIGIEIARNIIFAIRNSITGVVYVIQSTIRAGIDEAIRTEQTLSSFAAQNALQIGQQTGLPTGEVWAEAEKQAKQQLEFLRKLAKTSSFARTPIIEGYKTLRSFEYSAENAKIMMESIVRWADAFQPGNQQVIDTFTTQLGQMKTTGLLQMQDLKPLVQTANIPVMRYIAEYYRELPDALSNYTEEEIKSLPRAYADLQKVNVQSAQKQIIEDMAKKGLGATGVVMAIVEGLQADAERNMGKAKGLITGLLSTIDDMRVELMEKITAPVMQRFTKPILEYIVDILQSKGVTQFFDKLSEAIGNFSDSVQKAIALLLGFVRGAWSAIPDEGKRTIGFFLGVAFAMSKMSLIMAALTFGLKMLRKALLSLLPALAPILSIPGFIGIFRTAIPIIYKAYKANLLSIRDITRSVVYSIIDSFALAFSKVQDFLAVLFKKPEKGDKELVLASVSTEDGAKRAKELYDSFSKKIEEYAPKVQETIDKIFNPSKGKSPTTPDTGEGAEKISETQSVFENFLDWFISMFAQANQAVRDWFAAISEDFIGFADSVYQKATEFVSSFAGVWERIKEFGSALVPLIKSVVESVIKWLGEIPKNIQKMSKDMGKWGRELIKLFADGIMAGANFLIQAIRYIGWIISSLMEPHSPPPFLPNIDKWGKSTLQVYADGMYEGWNNNSPRLFRAIRDSFTENLESHSPPKILPDLSLWGASAADAYLSGWLKGDFEIMNEFAGRLESALAADEGALGEDEIKRIRQAVAQMVGAAVDGKVEIDAVMRAAGDWGGRSEQVERLTRAYAQMAIVQHQLAAEQKLLAEMTRKYDDMLKPLNRRLESIRRSQERMDLNDQIKEYERVISNVYATDKQKEAARLKLEELGLQKEINEITEEKATVIDPIQERIDLLERENEIAREALEIAQARWDVEVGLFNQKQAGGGQYDSVGSEAGGGIGGGEDDAGGSGKDRQFQLPVLPEMPALDTTAIVEFKERMVETAEKVKVAFSDMQKTFDEVTESIKKIKEQVGPLVDAFLRGYQFKVFSPDSDVISFFQNLGAVVRDLHEKISNLARELSGLLKVLGLTWAYGPHAGEVVEIPAGDEAPVSSGENTLVPQTNETAPAPLNIQKLSPSTEAMAWNQSATIADRISAVFQVMEKSLVDGSNNFGIEMVTFFEGDQWMPTEEELDHSQTVLSDKLKELFKSILDFVLETVGDYLKENIDEFIKLVLVNFVENPGNLSPDATSGEVALEAAKSIAKAVIGAIFEGIKSIDFSELGRSQGESIGKFVGEAIVGKVEDGVQDGMNSALDKEIPADQIGEAMGDKIQSEVLDGLNSKVQEQAAKGPEDDWMGEIITSLTFYIFDLISSLVQGAVNAVIKQKLGVGLPESDMSYSEFSRVLQGELDPDTLQPYNIPYSPYNAVRLPDVPPPPKPPDRDGFFGFWAPTEEEVAQQARQAAIDWFKAYNEQISNSNQSPEFKEAVAKIFKIIQDEAPNGADKTWETFAAALQQQVITDEDKNFALIGAAMVSGIDKGVMDFIDGENAFESPDALYEYFKKKFEIQSPSKLFAEGIGKPIGEGIWVGINEALIGGNTNGDAENGVTSPLQAFFDGILKKANDFSLSLQTAFTDLKTKVLETLGLAKQEWSDEFTDIYSETEENFDAFAERWISERMVPFKDNTIALVEELRLGISDKMLLIVEDILNKIQELLAKLTDEELLESFYKAGGKIGSSIVGGILDSFTSKGTKTKIERAANALVDSILSAVKSAAGIASPSKVMAEEVGVPLLQGVTTGMLEDRENAINAGGHLIDYIIMGAVAAIRAKNIPTESNLIDRGSYKPDTVVKQEIHHHLHITTTPAMATNAVYQFGVLEAMLS